MTRERNERSGKRVPVDVSGELRRKDDERAFAMCRVVNISSVGIQVESKEPVLQEKGVYVRFNLRNKLFEIPWDVVWTQNDQDTRRYGLRLTTVDNLTKDRIRRYVTDWLQEKTKDRFSQ